MVEPLTCTPKDENWSMSLPPIITEDISKVEVKLLGSSDNADMFILEGRAISVDSDGLAASCPESDSITLIFELSSAALGKNEQSISIEIKAPAKSEETTEATTAFAGVVIDDTVTESKEQQKPIVFEEFTKGKEGEPFEVKKLSITLLGALTIAFSKPIMPLPFTLA